MEPFPTTEPPAAKIRRNALLTLILTSVLFGLLIIPGVGVIMISPMVFDAPESQRNPKVLPFVIALVSYPVIAFLSIIGSWILYKLKRYKAAILVSLLPLLPVFIAFIFFLLLEM